MKGKWQLKSVEYPMRDDQGKALMDDGWEPFGVVPNGHVGVHLVYFRKLVETRPQNFVPDIRQY